MSLSSNNNGVLTCLNADLLVSGSFLYCGTIVVRRCHKTHRSTSRGFVNCWWVMGRQRLNNPKHHQKVSTVARRWSRNVLSSNITLHHLVASKSRKLLVIRDVLQLPLRNTGKSCAFRWSVGMTGTCQCLWQVVPVDRNILVAPWPEFRRSVSSSLAHRFSTGLLRRKWFGNVLASIVCSSLNLSIAACSLLVSSYNITLTNQLEVRLNFHLQGPGHSTSLGDGASNRKNGALTEIRISVMGR